MCEVGIEYEWSSLFDNLTLECETTVPVWENFAKWSSTTGSRLGYIEQSKITKTIQGSGEISGSSVNIVFKGNSNTIYSKVYKYHLQITNMSKAN